MAIISEVILWSTLAFLLWGVGQWGWHWYNTRFENGQTITLLFRDASQLMVGSPVHFMGTSVGFVTAIKPHNGRIQVEMKTFPDVVPIPKGAHFTIQFNSLAGAKTLEILPPKTAKDRKSNHYIVEEPIRLRDVLKTQMILAEALESSSNNMAKSLGEVKNERILMENLHQINQNLEDYENRLERTIDTIQGYLVQLHRFKTGSLGYVQQMIGGFHRLDTLTRPAFFKSQAAETVRYLAVGLEKTYQGFVQAKQDKTIAQFEHRLTQMDNQIIHLQTMAQKKLPQVFRGWACLNAGLCQTDTMLSRWQQSLQKRPLAPRIHSFRQTLENVNRQTRKMAYPQEPSSH